MYLERVLQINMATLAALGALLLGMGARNEAMPLLVASAAAAAMWLTDVTAWFRLNRWLANGIVLIAAAITLRAMIPLESQVQAFAVGWFLVCLQIVLLFQKKDERIYWMLVMLSLLEVVVATSFSQGVWFAAMLVVYMLFGFFAMTLLLLHRQWTSYQPRASGPRAGSSWQLTTASQVAADVKPARRRWPLAGEQSAFVSSPGGSIRAAVGRELLGRHGRMGLVTFALTLLLFFTLPRFGQLGWRGPTVHPQRLVGFSDKVTLGELGEIIESRSEVMRVQFSDYRTRKPYPMHAEIYLRGAVLTSYQHGQWSVGMPSLGYGPEQLRPAARVPEEGLVRQKIEIQGMDRNELFYVAPLIPVEFNSDVMMDRVKQRLIRSDEVCARPMDYELATTALMQGRQSMLLPVDPYDLLDSALQMPGALVPAATRAARARLPARFRGPASREEFAVPTGGIMAFGPASGGASAPGGPISGRMMLPAPRSAAPAARAAPRPAAVPDVNKPWTSWLGQWSSLLGLDAQPNAEQRPVADFRNSLPKLVALGNRWIKESGLPPEDRLGRARYLERQFGATGQFKYSLVGQPRDLNLDPVEDFLTLHREGHCEYFATALVLLLRSQGIPARLVIGYKCDEWNQLGGYYQVRQWHAHAWAEAYLPASQLPAELQHGKDYWPWSRGGWLQLDASATSGAPHQTSGWLTPLEHGLDWLDILWTKYVVEMNRQRQYDSIYQPLLRAFRSVARTLSDADWWRDRITAILNSLRTSGAAGAMAWGLLVVGILAGLFMLAVLGRWIWRLQRHLWIRWGGKRRGSALRRRDTHVQFYRRLEAILAQHGLLRSASQTQREFAIVAGARLAEAEGDRITPLMESIVEAFYRVRFGSEPLDSPQAQAVEHALAVLATIQRQRKTR